MVRSIVTFMWKLHNPKNMIKQATLGMGDPESTSAQRSEIDGNNERKSQSLEKVAIWREHRKGC